MHTIQIHGTSAEQNFFQLIGYSERVPILEVKHCLISALYWDSVMAAPIPLMTRRRTLHSLHSVEPPFGTLPPCYKTGTSNKITTASSNEARLLWCCRCAQTRDYRHRAIPASLARTASEQVRQVSSLVGQEISCRLAAHRSIFLLPLFSNLVRLAWLQV
ncbi:uncharacterized protein BDW70DRAFT_5349 [Aspergillus foveolatus]|uniref:uncharacterized protein n=1 Tax=Aspergillus foveolatus TaxID=210207 RepID=UPI003CCD1646